MTRSVKCPANMTGLCPVGSQLTGRATMCLLVKSLIYFHQKIPYKDSVTCLQRAKV